MIDSTENKDLDPSEISEMIIRGDSANAAAYFRQYIKNNLPKGDEVKAKVKLAELETRLDNILLEQYDAELDKILEELYRIAQANAEVEKAENLMKVRSILQDK